MMTRRTLFLDRLAILIVALGLIVGGGAGIWWWTGESPMLDRTDTSVLQDVVNMSWWPLVSAGAGVVLIVAGLRWLTAHLASQRVRLITLEGSGIEGRLAASAGTIADAGASVFADVLGVRSVKGTVQRERADAVVNLDATIEPWADLPSIARQADAVSSMLGRMLGAEVASFRATLRVSSRRRRGARTT